MNTTATLLDSALPEINRRGFLFLRFADPRTTATARVAALVNQAAAREPRAALLLALDEFAETAIERAPNAALLTGIALPACEAYLDARQLNYPKGNYLSHVLRQIVCERWRVGYSHDLANGGGSARGWKGLRLRTAATVAAGAVSTAV